MNFRKRIQSFLIPSLTLSFLMRLGCVALLSYLIFGHLLIPFHIRGKSMAPTYQDGSFNFCWRLRYLFSKPNRGDVVVIRLAGQKVMLLKRVVALENEGVEFRNGTLLINGEAMEEPYVRLPYDWTLPLRKVEPHSVYVVGDNRSGPMQNQVFGQVSMTRILGSPLW